jgi:hypothetical protein
MLYTLLHSNIVGMIGFYNIHAFYMLCKQNQSLGSLIVVRKLVNYLGLIYYYDFKYHDPDIIKSIIIMQNCALSCTIESKMVTQNGTRPIASQQFSIITSRQFYKIEAIIKRV